MNEICIGETGDIRIREPYGHGYLDRKITLRDILKLQTRIAELEIENATLKEQRRVLIDAVKNIEQDDPLDWAGDRHLQCRFCLHISQEPIEHRPSDGDEFDHAEDCYWLMARNAWEQVWEQLKQEGK